MNINNTNMNSLNQPWAISSKKRQRFGNTWADIDFEFNQLSEKNFEDEPYLTVVGTLSVANQRLQVNLKDLNDIQSNLKTLIPDAKILKGTHEVRIKTAYVQLNVSEMNRVYETVDDAITSIHRKYQLGLYL